MSKERTSGNESDLVHGVVVGSAAADIVARYAARSSCGQSARRQHHLLVPARRYLRASARAFELRDVLRFFWATPSLDRIYVVPRAEERA